MLALRAFRSAVSFVVPVVSARLAALCFAMLAGVTSLSAATTAPYVINVHEARDFTVVGNVAYYAARGGGYDQLWRTDGAPSGTVMIKQLSGEIGEIVPAGTQVFFTVGGRQLWVTDGSTAGTHLVRTFIGGQNPDSDIARLTALGNTIFFSADDGVTGPELWKSDGTEAGTVLVKNINPAPVDYSDYYSRAGWSWPWYLTPFNGILYFTATDGTNGMELWRSDGTAAGTSMVKDIYAGYSDSWPTYLTVSNGSLLFVAETSATGDEIWKSDGTPGGTQLVCDCLPGNTYGGVYYLTALNGKVWFVRHANATGTEPWVTDGTAAGTYMVKDIYPGSTSSGGYVTFHALGGRTYFAASDGVHGGELWSSDGTSAGTFMVRDINPGSAGGVSLIAASSTAIYMKAYEPLTGYEVWRSDGTETGTTIVADIGTGGGYWNEPAELTPFGSLLLFNENSDVYGLNSCDAPDAPTSLVAVASTNDIALTWDAMATAVRYDIYRSSADCPGTTFEKVGESTTASFTDTTANKGQPFSYKVIAVNAGGCSSLPSSCAIDLCTLPPPSVSFSGTPSACGYATGGTASAAPTSDGGMMYQWSYRTTSGGPLSDIPMQTMESYQLRATDFPGIGNYFLVCTTTSSCGVVSVSNELAVAITTTGTPPAISLMEANVCPGSIAYAETSTGYSSYQWSITNGTIDGSSTSSYVGFIAGLEGDVTLSLSVVEPGGCPASNSINVPLRAIPPPEISVMEADICPGSTGYANATGMYDTYLWSIENGLIIGGNANSYVSFEAGSTGPVTLTLTVDENGCTSSNTIEIPLRTIDPPAISLMEPDVCPGSTGYANSAAAYDSYLWSIENGLIIGGNTNSYVSFQAGTSDPVTLTLTVTLDGCSSTSNVVIPFATVGPPVIDSPVTEVCSGAMQYANAGGATSWSTYSWSIVNGTIDGGNTNSYVTFTPSGAGPVSLTLTTTNDRGCSNSATREFPLASIATPIIETSEPDVCPYWSSTMASVTNAPSGSTFAWSIENGSFSGASDQQSVLFYATSGNPVTLTVIVTAPNGCSNSGTKIVPITPTGCSFYAKAQAFTVTARDGVNKLEWINPDITNYDRTVIRYATNFPPGDIDSGTLLTERVGTPNAYDSYEHAVANGTTYYYSIFITTTIPAVGPLRSASGRPEPVAATKWIFNTGATAMTPPGIASIFAVSNDRMLHSIKQGTTGGDWPSGWKPFAMNAPSQSRPSVASMTINQIGGAPKVAFLSSHDGYVYAVNAATGAELWATQIGSMVMGSPSLAFRQYGIGLTTRDLVITGTRNSSGPNGVYALDTQGGAVAWSYTGGGTYDIGVIGSQVSIDYPTKRVYFASAAAGPEANRNHTLWCLSFDDDSVTHLWSVAIGDIFGSPIVRNGTLYVGNNAGTLFAIDPNSGATLATFATGDGPVKSFPFPGSGNRVYFSTTNKVWSISDKLTAPRELIPAWEIATIPMPSTAVLAGNVLYVGSANGQLYKISQLDSLTPAIASTPLGNNGAAVGTIGYDYQNQLAYVGTAEGAIYAVAIP